MNTDIDMDLSTVRPAGRRTVGTYTRYADTQRAVDYLSDMKFPVERVAIVAEGLRLVEQVTGRLTYGRAALNGALISTISHALTDGQRDFSSVDGIDAERYNVHVDEEVAAEAARLLASRGDRSRPGTPAARHLPQPV